MCLADCLRINIIVGTNLVKTTIRVYLSRRQSAPSDGANERIPLKSPERSARQSCAAAIWQYMLNMTLTESPCPLGKNRALTRRLKEDRCGRLAYGGSRFRRTRLVYRFKASGLPARVGTWKTFPKDQTISRNHHSSATDDRDRSCIGQHGHNMCIVCQVRRPGRLAASHGARRQTKCQHPSHNRVWPLGARRRIALFMGQHIIMPLWSQRQH
jgi:hypothetical protein